ncbi:MAG: response regulator [Armatimonadota bacterium]
MIRVLCVEDDPSVRSYLATRLSLEPDVQLVGLAGSAGAVLTYLRQEEIDVVLLDYELEGANGLQLLSTRSQWRRAGGAEEPPRVLFCTGFSDETLSGQAQAAGASGLVPKDRIGSELIPALREVAQGGAWFPVLPAETGRVKAEATVRVLVGEDEAPMRSLLSQLLPSIGCEPTLVWRGEDALRRLDEEPFDLVLLDHQLAGAMLGTDVLEAIGRRWPSMPVLFLTGLPIEVASHRSHPNLRGVVTKPFSVSQLREAIGRAIRPVETAKAI